MRLCNPSIRKSLLLPPCPLLPSDWRTPKFVLGFALHSQDYKVVAIAFKRIKRVELPVMGVAVYTLSNQQWSVRDNVLNIDYLSFKHLFGAYYFCEGAAHWLRDDAPDEDTSYYQLYNPTHLVSFDFDSEHFSFLELPVALDELENYSGSLFILGESLALFCISLLSFRIWVLKQENGNRLWTLWFSGPSSRDGYEFFYNMGSPTKRVLYFEGDGGYLVYGKKSYNIVTCQVRELGKSMCYDSQLATYSESLVLCNQLGTVDMA
ncbi:uncharacterized protein LOC141587762 [Silene latifolia]|uniref:uncharacterized protein LOC141587762 n=1 Tax=Silene latifolia TaxID=37657 RepID=UPI003D77D316